LNWFKAELDCSSDDLIIIEEVLLAFGAFTISNSDNGNSPIYEPNVGEIPLWKEIKVSALFDKKISYQGISHKLQLIPYTNLRISKVKEINWVEKYQKNFKPFMIGKNLSVVPSWSDADLSESRNVIKIDPGVAFGTGTHETTKLCLEFIEKNNFKNLTVCDYGCGSGILGIALAILGARRVYCYDHDPQAIKSTTANAKNNKVDKIIRENTDLRLLNNKIDFIISNIFLHSLVNLKETFKDLLNCGGILVVSGVLEKDSRELIEKFSNHFLLLDFFQKEDWCLFKFKKLSDIQKKC